MGWGAEEGPVKWAETARREPPGEAAAAQGDALAAEAFPGIKEWRLQHPRATFAEIEVAVDERPSPLRARLLQDVALASAAAAAAWTPPVARPACPVCAARGPGSGEEGRVEVRGRHTRRVTVAYRRAVTLPRDYTVSAVCGVGCPHSIRNSRSGPGRVAPPSSRAPSARERGVFSDLATCQLTAPKGGSNVIPIFQYSSEDTDSPEMNEELEELRQAVASLRSRLDEIAGEVGLSSSGAFAPDGSGTHPVVLPAVLEVPIGQDTGLLHMAIKPFLRRRLGDRNNAAQVLIDMVQRDRSGREFSWLTLPPPLLPGVYDESDGGRTSRLLRALGDDGNRRVLQVLWEGERETARLREQASVSAQDLQRRLTELEEIGWIAESKDDHFLLTERGRRALACARAVASALGGAPTQER